MQWLTRCRSSSSDIKWRRRWWSCFLAQRSLLLHANMHVSFGWVWFTRRTSSDTYLSRRVEPEWRQIFFNERLREMDLIDSRTKRKEKQLVIAVRIFLVFPRERYWNLASTHLIIRQHFFLHNWFILLINQFDQVHDHPHSPSIPLHIAFARFFMFILTPSIHILPTTSIRHSSPAALSSNVRDSQRAPQHRVVIEHEMKLHNIPLIKVQSERERVSVLSMRRRWSVQLASESPRLKSPRVECAGEEVDWTVLMDYEIFTARHVHYSLSPVLTRQLFRSRKCLSFCFSSSFFFFFRSNYLDQK